MFLKRTLWDRGKSFFLRAAYLGMFLMVRAPKPLGPYAFKMSEVRSLPVRGDEKWVQTGDWTCTGCQYDKSGQALVCRHIYVVYVYTNVGSIRHERSQTADKWRVTTMMRVAQNTKSMDLMPRRGGMNIGIFQPHHLEYQLKWLNSFNLAFTKHVPPPNKKK